MRDVAVARVRVCMCREVSMVCARERYGLGQAAAHGGHSFTLGSPLRGIGRIRGILCVYRIVLNTNH